MGDRANIVIQRGESRIYFYGHWSGYEAPKNLQESLKRGVSRWDDHSYLARIIFCGFVGKQNWDELTGFGISTNLTDNEYPLIIVDVDNQTVSFEAAGYCGKQAAGKKFSFAEYVQIEFGDDAWELGEAVAEEE